MGRLFSVALFPALALTSTGQTNGQATIPSPLSDLRWDDLKDKLSPSTALVDGSPSEYVSECYPVFESDDPTNHDLIEQPSGVCMDALFCGFKRCNPLAHENATVRELLGQLWPATDPKYASIDEWLRSSNPSYNLPPKVLFPQDTGDVYAAVDFAKQNGIQLSVKNSGHSYTGASTKKDTLLLNMNQFKRYSNATGGLVECDSTSTQDISPDLSNQPCQLALARNKPATLRVGGGENFDKVYRFVKEYNELQDGGYKYHLVGGAAGTVSPMGWTWQGGLSGTTNGRSHGFGVDQVLQIEMILPIGHHVRFGPTKWQVDDAFHYPRTTEVSGVCNEKPYDDEDSWVWTACPDDIDFGELWFAVNGGGGGTYGIVVAVQLQLHEYLPYSIMLWGNGALAMSCDFPIEDTFGPLGRTTWSFLIDFFLNPSDVGVSEDVSNSCGAPSYEPYVAGVSCFGDGIIEEMLAAWKDFLSGRNQTLLDSGVPSASIDKAAVCFDEKVAYALDYAEIILRPEGRSHAGKADDNPKPSYPSDTSPAMNILIPKDFAIENKEKVIDWLLLGQSNYWAFGGKTASAQDQSISLSDAHREAGLMLFVPQESIDESFYRDIFPQMYDVTGDNFPGFVGSNHAGIFTRGPLKSDWSKPCSLDWTEDERDEKCISLQEAIWGTEKLARLEAVKNAVDPNRMLECYGCVGSNRPVSSDIESPPIDTGASSTDASEAHTSAVELATSSIIGCFSLLICFVLLS